VLLKLLDGALKFCPLVQAILFDSWFSFPSLIRKCSTQGLSVVGMLKNTSKIYYSLGVKPLSLASLFTWISEKTAKPNHWLLCGQPQSDWGTTFSPDRLGPQ